MTELDLTVVIVNWNASDRLGACLASLETERTELSLEAIVIDNASEDGGPAAAMKPYPWARLIQNEVNAGFARANNQGFAAARGAFILLLNPDARLAPGAARAMIALLRARPDVGLVGPKVRDARGRVTRACRRPRQSLWQIAKGLFLTDRLAYWLLRKTFGRRFTRWADRRFEHSGPTDCIQGSCMMTRREDLAMTGWFDERVPMYLDDGDLCRRMALQNRLVFYLAEAEAVHEGAVSVNRMANTRMSSMVGSLAIDAYFFKHGSLFEVGAYHAMLLGSSVVFLAVDVLLWPVLGFVNRRFIREYSVKHYCTLVYSLTFRFRSSALEPSWPRSILRAYLADRRLDGGLPPEGRGRWPARPRSD